MNGPLPIERGQNGDETRFEEFTHEGVDQHGVATEPPARGRVAHRRDDTPRPGLVRVSLATLMVSEVTFSVETTAADLRPVLLRLARELRKETEQLGITARQATLLWLVKRSPGLSLAELASEEGISAPAMSGHVDRLERAGLIERVRSDDDRRRVGLRLTEDGLRLLRRVRARRTSWLADRLGELEPAELDAVEAALPALARLVGDL